jgi:glycosyltransferase involved in cell wall biosynthesis
MPFEKMPGNRIVAVIPAYNEGRFIGDVVRATRRYVDDVIVIDDASCDDTYEKARNGGALVLRHRVNLHKGAALKTGCEAAMLLGADIIINLDGDGQHDPHEIRDFIRKIEKVDFVFGVRKFNKNMPLVSKLGNIFLSKLLQLIYGNKVSDSQTGYRAFRASVYPKISWEANDYRVESEIISNIHRKKISYGEVRIKTIYNDKFKGTTPIDGLKIAASILMGIFKK